MTDQPIEPTNVTYPELDVRWEQTPEFWKVTAKYGDAHLELTSSSEAGAEHLETLIQGLPQIMHHVHVDMSQKGAL